MGVLSVRAGQVVRWHRGAQGKNYGSVARVEGN